MSDSIKHDHEPLKEREQPNTKQLAAKTSTESLAGGESKVVVHLEAKGDGFIAKMARRWKETQAFNKPVPPRVM